MQAGSGPVSEVMEGEAEIHITGILGVEILIESRRVVGLACNEGWSTELCHQAMKWGSEKAKCMNTELPEAIRIT